MVLQTERQRIQHLLRRAGWSYSAAELEEYLALGLEGAVDRLLRPEDVDDSASDEAIEALIEADPREKRGALIGTWYMRLLTTRRPLLERMTYFWHDHFATALHKVGNPYPMHVQNETLRRLALGDFQELLQAITRDPAMMIWLDNRTNVKDATSENYARELLELHTLGEGVRYTETDIKEAARALTGWVVLGPRQTDGVPGARFVPRRHDGGEKTFLGVTGHLDDADIVEILATDSATADFVGRKLWRFFAMPEPGPELIERTTAVYFDSDRSIREVVRTILLSDEMYTTTAYRWRVKSPVELVIGAERALELSAPLRSEPHQTQAMGQLLFDPPNPAGWPEGGGWINSNTLLGRTNYANELTRFRRRAVFDPAALVRRHGAEESAEAVVDFLLDLLVGGDVDEPTRALLVAHLGCAHHFDLEAATRDGSLAGAVYLALTMPLYQLA